MRRTLTGVVVSGFLFAFVLPGTALAHVTVSPEEVRPGATQEFTAQVPTEKDIPTTGVRFRVPDGFEVVEVRSPRGGWRGTIGDGEIAWSGGEIGAGGMEITSPEGEVIPMGGSEEFSFTARAPEDPGPYAWPATQTYEDGSTVEWAGPVESGTPAPTVEVAAAGAQTTSAHAKHHDHGAGAAHDHRPGTGDRKRPSDGQKTASSTGSDDPSSPYLLAGVAALVGSSAVVVGVAVLRNGGRQRG